MAGSSYAQGSSGSSYDDSAEFRITLGMPTTISGISAFPLLFSGQPHTNTSDFVANRWSHIAIDGHKIYASADGSTLIEIFDAEDGNLLGSGFFQPFSNNRLYTIESSSLSNDFYNGPAYRVAESAQSGQCEYFPEIGQTICGSDTQTSYQEREYYVPDLGPVGYYYYSAYSSCGGGFCSGSNSTIDIGLIASSLRNDTVSYELEQEPDNSPALAQVLNLPATIKSGFYKEADYGATTTLNLSSISETVSHSTAVTAQAIPLPNVVTGDILAAEGGEDLIINNFPASGNTYTESIEDWFIISPPATGIYDINLNFEGSTAADLDLFLLRQSDNFILRYQINDNLAPGATQSEAISSVQLSNQAYYILVDAYDTNSQRIDYTLTVTAGNAQIQFEPKDWYEFELNSQYQVSITASGGVGLILVDASSTQILAHDMPATYNEATGITSDLLQPGTYRIGVIETSSYSDNNYQLTVSTF